MTDLPQDPAEPTPAEPTTPLPTPSPEAASAPPPEAASALPPPPAAAPPAAAPPAAPPPPAAAPLAAPPPAAAPPAAPPITPGAPPPAPYGQANAAAAQPNYPQAGANPYGGYGQAPVYAGGPAYPGSLAYVEQNYGKVANFGQRALAYLVDMAITLIGLIPVILGLILIAAAVPSNISTDQFGNTTTSGDANAGLAVVGGLLIALGALLAIGITIWNRVFKMGRTGQSVGKKVIGLYLLDDKTGQPVGAGMTFLREIVNSLVNQVVYIGWLWMLWDADKQTLGDKAVHSSVVVVPKH